MPKKLKLDALKAEKSSIENLLNEAGAAGDFVGKMQLQHRLESISTEISDLQKHKMSDNSASVAIFFGGRPVFGSKGISAEFAGAALEQFQDLISKTFARNEVGEIGTRGRVPLKTQSELMVTGLARGSFGFILDEMSGQLELAQSELTHVVEETTQILRDTAAQDEAVFEQLTETLDGRTLLSLRDFFSNLDTNQATIRIVEGEQDIVLDNAAIHRGKVRTEATSIDEEFEIVTGVLLGFLPEHRKFEIRQDDGRLLYGSATKESVAQFESAGSSALGNYCSASITIKTIKPLNRPPREVIRLVEFINLQN